MSPALLGGVGVHANSIVFGPAKGGTCPLRDGVRLMPCLLRFVTAGNKIGQ